MSKIEELIKKHCPDGVEYKTIKELAEVGTGSSNGNEAEEDGIYPFFVRSQIVKRKNSYEYDEEAVIIPGEGGIGDIFHYYNGKYALHQRVYRIHFLMTTINVRFAYYYMFAFFKPFILKKAVSATVTSIRKPMIEDFSIPVPPLPVQEEIVRILDKFTELEAELEAELDCRKRQYEYYRNKLLSFSEIGGGIARQVKWMKMSEIAEIYDGTHQTPKYIDKGVKFVSVENIRDLYGTNKYISKSDYDKNYKVKPQKKDLFMTRIGSIGSCQVVDRDEPIAYYVTLTLIRPNQKMVNSKYLKHIIESSTGKRELNKRVLVNAVPIKINLGDIGKISIPIPPLSEQERIVAILDKFDALVNDLTQGLPAEIEARRKQYEYYRNKLLTFRECKIL